jgi:hypothetical protein
LTAYSTRPIATHIARSGTPLLGVLVGGGPPTRRSCPAPHRRADLIGGGQDGPDIGPAGVLGPGQERVGAPPN